MYRNKYGLFMYQISSPINLHFHHNFPWNLIFCWPWKRFPPSFSAGLEDSNSTTEVILTQSSSSYTSLLQSLIRNLRFLNSSVPKPNLIVTPQNLAHIQAAITCSRKHGLQVRVRSGGHDYEGMTMRVFLMSLMFHSSSLIS